MKRYLLSFILGCSLLSTGGQALARQVDVIAEAVATVQASGARGEPEGFRFFNIVGSSSRFASFGIVEFNLSAARGLTLSPNSSMKLALTQRNANFSRGGRYSIHLAGGGLDESIFPGSVHFRFNVEEGERGMNVSGVDYPIWKIGEGTFDLLESGHVDSIPFTLSDWPTAAGLYFQEALTNGSRIRIFLLPEDSSVAATWSGVEPSRNFSPPTLVLDFR